MYAELFTVPVLSPLGFSAGHIGAGISQQSNDAVHFRIEHAMSLLVANIG
jgi:hypothetical protein